MANEQLKLKISAALTKLDPANDDHWTPDGLPKVVAVQKFASDQSITFRAIQEAAPGFERPASGMNGAATDDFGPIEPIAPPPVEAGAEAGADEGRELTDEEVRMILAQRVTDAKAAVEAARAKGREAQQEEAAALKVMTAATVEMRKNFPAPTDAQNRKAFIEAENAARMARMSSRAAQPARVDAAMGRGNNRGWGRRMVRGVAGPDGNLMRLPDGSIAMPKSLAETTRAARFAAARAQ